MENTAQARVDKANEIMALINQTKPVKDWGFTVRVWTAPPRSIGASGPLAGVTKMDAGAVRVYVNDKKRNPAAIIEINEDCSLSPEWQSGHSMTRNEIRAALGI